MYFRTLLFFVFIKITLQFPEQDDQVKKWVTEIGENLWKLGETVTKFKEIQGKYLFSDATVETKNHTKLIDEVCTDIETMMDRKSDAIKCIQKTAEEAAEMFAYNDTFYQYVSSKYSAAKDWAPELPKSLRPNKEMYLNLTNINVDTHFYNLPVDTNQSAVHVPTNIHDRHEAAATAIRWSEALNEVFRTNYNADPALLWQYFGSTSGVLRLYPAKTWPNLDKDEFDCRDRTWYIEAATCTKDVVILVDNSGSMDGMGKHVAKLTVINILDTFSNNDYVNILYYNLTTNYTVPCFEDILVQATPENVHLFKDAMLKLDPAGKTNLSQALDEAFRLLMRYRIERNCDVFDEEENGTINACNQAIMVITDSAAGNLSDLVLKYNAQKSVRLFTYLIGKEASKVNELQWMACSSRGYYMQVQTLEQVSSAVLQYINVVARPLVLQGVDHPTSWTHAYADPSYDDKRDSQINEPYRLVTSAAVPAFDLKSNKDPTARTADLLGVAGTDVPIRDIEKLTFPYKLGVNAYAFIISNNGYVLMHRDLRPMFRGKFRKNYNSIDLIEIEQFDDDREERDFSMDLKKLRNVISNGSSGQIENIPIKYHYDSMKRVTRANYSYYYAPLEETPFSLGFAIPGGYGDYFLQGDDEIKLTIDGQVSGNIIDYFIGENWKIHPKWVYCKYHYPEGHEYETPEQELVHFLGIMHQKDFKWVKQYETNKEESLSEVVCGRKTHGNDDYYCDRQLVQRLVFDARQTFDAFPVSSNWTPVQTLLERFNVTLRFVATMSGLTRWEYISEQVENNTDAEFGDYHSKAIDETWYRSAVIQHEYDFESFVYSVPLNTTNEEVFVTASYAIFPSNGTAPGSVVGYQFTHEKLTKYVENVTRKLSGDCASCHTCEVFLECYVIDSNAYILLAKTKPEIGKFFGQIEPDVMTSLQERAVFENVTIYDYQSICFPPKKKKSAGSSVSGIINWAFMKLTWLVLEANFNMVFSPSFVLSDDEEEEEEKKEKHYDCDKKRTLYILRQDLFFGGLHKGEVDTGKLNYYYHKIPHTNLLFIAINDTLKRKTGTVDDFDVTEAQEIQYFGEDLACKKMVLNNLPRRRLAGCYYGHKLEAEIDACGTGAIIALPVWFWVLIAMDFLECLM